MNTEVTVDVYLDDGRVFYYTVSDPQKGREHAHAITTGGYRSCRNGEFEHYPVHRILKVKLTGPGITSKYQDQVRGT